MTDEKSIDHILDMVDKDPWLGSGFYEIEIEESSEEISVPNIEDGKVLGVFPLIEKTYVIKVRYRR